MKSFTFQFHGSCCFDFQNDVSSGTFLFWFLLGFALELMLFRTQWCFGVWIKKISVDSCIFNKIFENMVAVLRGNVLGYYTLSRSASAILSTARVNGVVPWLPSITYAQNARQMLALNRSLLEKATCFCHFTGAHVECSLYARASHSTVSKCRRPEHQWGPKERKPECNTVLYISVLVQTIEVVQGYTSSIKGVVYARPVYTGPLLL